MKTAEDFLLQQIKNNETPSVQYLIFNKDAVIYQFLHGLADVKNKRAITEADAYHAFSTTKTFTALAVLQLTEKNLLNIEEPVIKYLPGFSYGSAITIKHLLNHTAGIPNPIPLSWIHTAAEHKTFNRYKFFNQIFEKNPAIKSKPNEKFAYSNLGYIWLGQLIEKVSGLSYEQYILKNIIGKLDIQPGELGFDFDGNRFQVKGYQKRFSFSNLILSLLIDKPKFMGEAEDRWKPFKPYYINGTPYGGLIGTANGFMKYLQELLKPHSNLISEDFKQLLFRENRTNNNQPTGMCLSWYTGQLNGKQYFCHAGGGGGYYCEIRLYPAIGIGSVIMFNRTGMNDERILDQVDKYFVG